MSNKSDKAELQKVSEEIMRFMRGKYKLDEIPGKYYDIDCLKFRQGRKTILSINIHDEHYDFQIIYGKAEREKFEARLDEFPKSIQDLYNNSRALHDGLWMLIRVDNLEMLEAVKHMILIKKNPNRKPFSKTHIHIANCGHRCDLCIHYKGKTSFTAEEKEWRLACHKAVYGDISWEENCDGCHFPDCTVESADCRKAKGIEKCWACDNYSTCLKTAGWPPEIHTRTITADQVTWAILPYVKGQYGN
ncbi:MAG: DUF3788 domain-containing protein [Oscillospiraceae bacterium]|nr:DUF3788 domain-containing protein [Oscillospiraceae bacterium]